MSERTLTQRTRFLLLLIDVVVLCAGSAVAFGTLFPPNNDKGFWFYTALLGLVLGSRLDTPFFAKPADVVLYAAPAVAALALCNSWAQWSDTIRVSYALATSFCVLVALLGAFAILTVESSSPEWRRASNSARVVAEVLGAPRVIYSVVIAFALLAFHASSARELGVIGAAWVVTGVLSPFEGALEIVRRLRRLFTPGVVLSVDGTVIAHQTPGLFVVRSSGSTALAPGTVIAMHDPPGRTTFALSLDHVGRDEGFLVRAVELTNVDATQEEWKRYSALPPGAVALVPALDRALEKHALVRSGNDVVGLVAPDTSVETLFFEVVRDGELEEGRLVEVPIGKRFVTYQVVNGLTREEVVRQRNTRGFARAQGQKLGEWDSNAHRFRPVKWLPAPNAPVFLKKLEAFRPRSTSVGHFPGTNYDVSVKSVDDLVTHNTAVLGILGVGKSMLAIELVERMMATGIKVVCLDLTNQYAQELADYYDFDHEVKCLAQIQEAGSRDSEKWADRPEDGGSLPGLRDAIADDLKAFLDESNPSRLKIYNPAQVRASKQLTEPKSFNDGAWKRNAPLWSVTPVEMTRLVTECVLALLQGRMTERARVCLVFEEAHSLIPETTAVASALDREASNGTARAILQGRKFGLGCLVVTQRTANVTKTILNQCNTVFAMRTFDETGKTFLGNYIGRAYAESLSTLSERHAVIFGKASSCENPVLIRLNDRDQFLREFRVSHPAPRAREGAAKSGEVVEAMSEQAPASGEA